MTLVLRDEILEETNVTATCLVSSGRDSCRQITNFTIDDLRVLMRTTAIVNAVIGQISSEFPM